MPFLISRTSRSFPSPASTETAVLLLALGLFFPVKLFSLPVVKVKGKRKLPLPASQLHCSLSVKHLHCWLLRLLNLLQRPLVSFQRSSVVDSQVGFGARASLITTASCLFVTCGFETTSANSPALILPF